MKKEDVLLRLIAISGELPAGLVGEIVESESYAAALITRLKKENYISVRNAGGYKGYVLRRKGKRYLLERYEDDLSFFLSGSAQTNHVKSEPVYSIRITVNSIRNDGTTRKDPGNGGKPRKIKGFSELMKRGGTRIDTFFEKRAHFSEQKEKLSTLSTKRAGKPHKQRVPGSFLNWNE